MSVHAGADELPQRQRVAAYAVILRGEHMLLSRLAPYLFEDEMWSLPGGGLDFGEHPRDAVVREVHEETGLHVTLGEWTWVDSARRLVDHRQVDLHSLRIVYDGWVPRDAPEPHVVEEDGSTVAAGWHLVSDIVSGAVPTVPTVRAALAAYRPNRHQRLAAYALVRRNDDVLLTRISPRGFNTGAWTLPGGGIEHGETPLDALVREVREECALECTPGRLLGVHDTHFSGTAPSGRMEDFHGVHLVFAAEVAPDAVPRVAEPDGTTDAVAWVPVADVVAGRIEVLDVVAFALENAGGHDD